MAQNSTNFDAIVIGGGHNGLTAASVLARKGKRVCLLERSGSLGGMMSVGGSDDAQTPPRLAHLLYNLNPTVEREIGLQLQTKALKTISLSPDGQHVEIDGPRTRMMNGQPHEKAVAYGVLHDRFVRYARLLSTLSTRTPPKLSGSWTDPETFGELMALAGMGWGLKRMGKAEMREFLRILLTNVHDLAVDELGDGPLAGALAADALRGAFSGPKAPGTLFSLLYRFGNSGQVLTPVGGMSAAVKAFEDAAQRAGCELRCHAAVERVLVEDDRAVGVTLGDGTTLKAKAVFSSAGPLATIQLAGLENFDVEIARRAKNLRAKGTAAKLNLKLSALPSFKDLPEDLHGERLLIAPSSEYVERAFNPVKYGRISSAPSMEILLPHAKDPRASQWLSAIVSYVPYQPDGGWTADKRDEVQKTALSTLEAYAPGLSGLIQHAELLTPADIEKETGAAGGHWHHGEMGIDQILNVRPINGMAHYHCGVKGLYLCGASAHPGGDISGAPGRNSALQALKDGVV